MPDKDPNIKPKEIEDISILESREHEIILYNDDVNTFDHVIECLVKICEHTYIQAEQCAWLVHNRGKCNVKSGKLTILRKMQNALTQNGLSAEVE